MDKEEIRKIINDVIDFADEIHNFSISNKTEDTTTIEDGWKKIKSTGATNICITAYKEQK